MMMMQHYILFATSPHHSLLARSVKKVDYVIAVLFSIYPIKKKSVFLIANVTRHAIKREIPSFFFVVSLRRCMINYFFFPFEPLFNKTIHTLINLDPIIYILKEGSLPGHQENKM